jgi:hypothetical protein
LETKEGEITKPALLRADIEEYYKRLFRREERGDLRLDRNL